ncbi:MAG: diadenylate cyclase CdaA [Lentisphaeria bacterium]
MNLMAWLELLPGILRTLCEIAILTLLIYSALNFLRGTRSSTVLAGFIIVALMLSFLSQALQLEVIEWILTKMWALAALGVLIIFQPEIRRAFAEIGSSQARLRSASRLERQRIDTIVNSVMYLASHRIGALIALERDIGMRGICETGTRINAPLSQELLTTFFYPDTPLHDGGVVIKGGTILAAGCIFPLTRDPDMSKSLGTRHRAGVGLTEETDTVVLIVSEESGAISLGYKGRLVRGLNRQRLERHLLTHMVRSRQQEKERLKAPSLKKLRDELDENEAVDGEAETEEATGTK